MRGRASDVAVVIPVGGAAPAWERSARSLARLDPVPGELVVVVDGPNQRLSDVAAALAARVVTLEQRGGPARARNRGVDTTRRDIVLFIDADVEVPTDLVGRVADLFASEPAVDALFGSYDAFPGDPGFLSQYRNLLHHFVHQNGREEASTFWAGCGAVRRSVFHAVGGFDERCREPSIEDIELGARLVRAGRSVRLVKELQVKHLKRWGLLDMLTTDLWRRAVPWTELMLREGEAVNDLNVRTRDRLGVAAAFVPLLALPATWLWPPSLLVAAAGLVLVVALNHSLFGFFARSKGVLFALGTVPLYWVFLLVCGLGVVAGLSRHLLGTWIPRRSSEPR